MSDHVDRRPPADDEEVHELTQGIERTRSEMSATLQELEHRLSPAELGEQAKVQLDQLEARVRVLVKEGLGETKEVLQEQIEAAKSAVKEELDDAKEKVAQGLSDARETIKKDIETAIVGTKQAVREATIGRVEKLATQAGDVMNDTRDTIMETIRQNPVPAALAGIGLAWLLMNRSSSSRRRASGGSYGGRQESLLGHAASEVGHRAGETLHHMGSALGDAGSAVSTAAHQATDAVGGVVNQGIEAASHLAEGASATARRIAHDASETGGRLAHQAQDFAAGAAHSVRDQAMRAERGLESTYKANPLALGAVALAAGAMVGYALPRTQKEDELMGKVRDRLLQGATEMAHDASQSLHHLTEEAAGAAKKAVTSPATK